MKEELYKYINSKRNIGTFLIIYIYTAALFYLYKKQSINIIDMFYNFTNEYLPLIIVLSFLFTTNTIYSEIKSSSSKEMDSFKMIIYKNTIILLNILILYVILILSSYNLSFILYKEPSIPIISIIKALLRLLPQIVIYNEILYVIIVITKKEALSLCFGYLIYIGSSLLPMLINNPNTYLKKSFYINFNFNLITDLRTIYLYLPIIILIYLYISLIIYLLLKYKDKL